MPTTKPARAWKHPRRGRARGWGLQKCRVMLHDSWSDPMIAVVVCHRIYGGNQQPLAKGDTATGARKSIASEGNDVDTNSYYN